MDSTSNGHLNPVQKWRETFLQNRNDEHDDEHDDGLGDFRDSVDAINDPTPRPAELIEGVAFVGSKISMSSDSKGHKTYFQIDLGACIASGTKWLGRDTLQGNVLYINLELCKYSFENRLREICEARGITLKAGQFQTWHLRGKHVTIEMLRDGLLKRVRSGDFALIIFDPLYKLLGDRHENDSGDMADLFNILESVAHEAGAAYLVAHHYTKGSAGDRKSLDRAAGSNVIGRDGDCIITLTAHEGTSVQPQYSTPTMRAAEVKIAVECVAMEITVRDFAPPGKRVLRWEYPVFELDNTGLSPEKLKTSKASNAKPPITREETLFAMNKPRMTREQFLSELMKTTQRSENPCRLAIKLLLDSPSSQSSQAEFLKETLSQKPKKSINVYTRKDLIPSSQSSQADVL